MKALSLWKNRNHGRNRLATFKWFGIISMLAAILMAGAYAAQGFALALLIVAGMFTTIEVVPGFEWFATTRIGMPIVIALTAVVVMHMISIGTIVGMFAMGFALVLKTGLLRLARYARLQPVKAYA